MDLQTRLTNLQSEYQKIRIQILDNDEKSEQLNNLLNQLSGAVQIVSAIIEEEKKQEDKDANSKSS